MSAVSAIGLQLCPMATNEKCSNDSDITVNVFALNPTPAYQTSSLDDNKANPDIQVNVYVSATIHHNNVTINSDQVINTKSVNNITTTSSTDHSVWRKYFPNFEFLRSWINSSIDTAQVKDDIGEVLPKSFFSKTETNSNYATKDVATNATDDKPIDPCSHPEYIVFTWVSCNIKR